MNSATARAACAEGVGMVVSNGGREPPESGGAA